MLEIFSEWFYKKKCGVGNIGMAQLDYISGQNSMIIARVQKNII